MAEEALKPSPGLMENVPARLRGQILSGMRWTLWLSVLAAPFGYGTNILLARVSPEALGTYGLLMVYISLVFCWFYVGGDAVIIKYVPILESSQRLGFLLSYLLVVCAFLAVWLGLAAFWPTALHYFFGESGGAPFHALIICLSPIPIIYSLVAAALKGTMEIRWAQTMRRVLTIGTFITYGALFVAAGQWLGAYYTYVIWGVYLGLTGLTAILGGQYLLRLPSWTPDRRRLDFNLPPGFWKFTFSLQQLSGLTFFIRKLDYLLVLNFGGLAVLGLYVAIISLADVIRVLAEYFLETLLPSLTNLLASKNLEGASQVLTINLRLMFVVSLGITSGLLFLVTPITSLLGPSYTSLRHLFVLMLVFFGIALPGSVGATLLTSLGKQQRTGRAAPDRPRGLTLLRAVAKIQTPGGHPRIWYFHGVSGHLGFGSCQMDGSGRVFCPTGLRAVCPGLHPGGSSSYPIGVCLDVRGIACLDGYDGPVPGSGKVPTCRMPEPFALFCSRQDKSRPRFVRQLSTSTKKDS